MTDEAIEKLYGIMREQKEAFDKLDRTIENRLTEIKTDVKMLANDQYARWGANDKNMIEINEAIWGNGKPGVREEVTIIKTKIGHLEEGENKKASSQKWVIGLVITTLFTIIGTVFQLSSILSKMPSN